MLKPHPLSMCAGKVRFSDKAKAREAAKRREKRGAYHCIHCGGWHTGQGKGVEQTTRAYKHRKAELMLKECALTNL